MRYLITLLLALVLVGCSVSTTPPLAVTRTVTINGYDNTDALIDPINVWDSITNRQRVVATVHNGDRVGFVQQQGDRAQIEVANKVRGWVSIEFIRELKP